MVLPDGHVECVVECCTEYWNGTGLQGSAIRKATVKVFSSLIIVFISRLHLIKLFISALDDLLHQ
jgi:hypothetical protein